MKRLLLGLVTLLLAACSTGKLVDASDLPQVTMSAQAGSEDYQLSAGDKIRVIVFNEESLSNEFLIGANGVLAFPLIGDVNASGKTTSQLGDEIASRLADGYLKSPRVNVEVLSFRPFYILGEVNKPGQYPYAAGLTLLNAVATAQGFTYRAERRVAYIRRAGMSEEAAVRITPDLMVAPGDTIRIGERYF